MVDAVLRIAKSRNAPKRRYIHLLHLLSLHGCVELPSGLPAFVERDTMRGLGRPLGQVRVTAEPDEFEIEVVSAQPRNTTGDANVIDFDRFASVVDSHGDAVSRAFVHHLRR